MSEVQERILGVQPAFAELFQPGTPEFPRKRFYVYFGGRASGKSHAIATAAILRAYYGLERILCVREIQRTISDSIHRLLSDKIKFLGLEPFFTITDNEIRCPRTGSTFIFKGLGTNVSESVRSIEAVTLCLSEESQAITEHSWSILLPSVLRVETSEVWIVFNPDTVEDPVYKRFVENCEPERMHVRQVNYDENPFLPSGIKEQIEADRKRDPESFQNIWLGVPRVAREGGIFLPEKIGILPTIPAGLRLARGWDLASSAVIQKKNGITTDPDYTVGALMGFDMSTGIYVIADIVRMRGTPDAVEQAIVNTTELDGLEIQQSIAQDPGQAGVSQIQYYARKLVGYRLHTSTETGSKAVRADPFASQVNSGNVKMVKASWNEALVNEFKGFNGEKNGGHDDIVDACSRAFTLLTKPQYMTRLKLW